MASDSTAIWAGIARICAYLRGEQGCSWDRAQTPESLLPYLLEEVHEVAEALAARGPEELTEEVGDAIYLWVFFMQVLEDSGRIRLDEAARSIEEKLKRRHPHLFGSGNGATDEASPRSAWEKRKRLEAPAGAEILRPLPPGLPALLRARRLQEKAAAFGFDWRAAKDVFPKVREEVEELALAIESGSSAGAVREELGDLLFAVVNLARHLGEDPEAALSAATEKFRGRFNRMADAVEERGRRMGEVPLDELEIAWQEEKRRRPTETPPKDR